MEKRIEELHTEDLKYMPVQKDYVCFTILCYLEKNEKEFKIDSRFRSKLLMNNILLICLQLALVVGLVSEIIEDRTGNYDLNTKSFRLFLAKFIASVCMHL